MEKRQGLVYFDRYEQSLKSEGIYGEKALRWTYETTLGRLFLEGIVKHSWFSRLYGKWADCSCSASEILPFIERFGLDREEFLDLPETYSSFNEFFSRKLKPEARPVASGQHDVCFPADGRHLLVPDLSLEHTLYAKNQRFDLPTLLGDASLAEHFAEGTAILSRLCPTDYHRFHFPLGGIPDEPRLLNGVLYSVNPIALARNFSYLRENKRRVTVVRDSPAGEYLFLEIGATNVGSIVDTSEAGVPVAIGAEKGAFRFGGSMVITIFAKDRFQPAEDLIQHSREGVEIYARFGDAMGQWTE